MFDWMEYQVFEMQLLELVQLNLETKAC